MSEPLPAIYLARHGETAWSLTGQHTGRTDLPLTANGERQAAGAGRARCAASRSPRCSRVRCSGRRARAHWRASPTGRVADADLVEWNYGAYEGKRTADIRAARAGLEPLSRRVSRRRDGRRRRRARGPGPGARPCGHGQRARCSRAATSCACWPHAGSASRPEGGTVPDARHRERVDPGLRTRSLGARHRALERAVSYRGMINVGMVSGRSTRRTLRTRTLWNRRMSPTSDTPPELSAFGPARATVAGAPLSAAELATVDAYWRAAKYLALGMIYLQDNPLLREPLAPAHLKNRLLGHWGASPALAFVYTHLNRLIRAHDLDMIFMAGPGHGAPGVIGPVYLEGSYSEVYPECGSGRRRDARALPPVLVSRRHRQPLHARVAGFDPRRRRTRLRAVARLWCGVRQPGPDRRGGGGRRRVRNGAAGHVVAREQVPESGPRRRGAADPQPQRLQDQQSDAARAHHAARARGRCCAASAGSRTSSKARTPRRCTRRWRRRSTSASSDILAARQAARERRPGGARALADDRAAHAEGVDRAGGGRRAQARRVRGARTRCPFRTRSRIRAISRCSSEWMHSYRPEELFNADGRAGAGIGRATRRWARGAWAAIRTPTAARSRRRCKLPDFRDYAVRARQDRA